MEGVCVCVRSSANCGDNSAMTGHTVRDSINDTPSAYAGNKYDDCVAYVFFFKKIFVKRNTYTKSRNIKYINPLSISKQKTKSFLNKTTHQCNNGAF